MEKSDFDMISPHCFSLKWEFGVLLLPEGENCRSLALGIWYLPGMYWGRIDGLVDCWMNGWEVYS